MIICGKKENQYVEQMIFGMQKRLGLSKEDAKKQGVEGEAKKATVIREGKTVRILTKSNTIYTPDIWIQNVDTMEKTLEEYIETIRTTDIRSTQMDARHNEKYFIYNIWKNATWYDFQNPEKFIQRYTNFIKDETFSEYDQKTKIGEMDGNEIYVERLQDEYGFETPYVLQYSIQRDNHCYQFPIIRYGITRNRQGGKLAYIYALQGKKEPEGTTYQEEIRSFCNKANSGVHKHRNVSPSALVALTLFFGMLEKENIQAVKAPVFLVGRYGRFAGAKTEEETNRIQNNLTGRFLRNFFRITNHFPNVEIQPFMNDGYDSFLLMTFGKMQECNQPFLKQIYEIGRDSGKDIEKEESYR